MKIDHGVKFATFRDRMVELVELFPTGGRHLSLRCSPLLVASLPLGSLLANNTEMIHGIGRLARFCSNDRLNGVTRPGRVRLDAEKYLIAKHFDLAIATMRGWRVGVGVRRRFLVRVHLDVQG